MNPDKKARTTIVEDTLLQTKGWRDEKMKDVETEAKHNFYRGVGNLFYMLISDAVKAEDESSVKELITEFKKYYEMW